MLLPRGWEHVRRVLDTILSTRIHGEKPSSGQICCSSIIIALCWTKKHDHASASLAPVIKTHLKTRGFRKEVRYDALLKEGSGELSALNGHIGEQALLICLAEDILLHGPLANQAVDVHISGLADTVASADRHKS